MPANLCIYTCNMYIKFEVVSFPTKQVPIITIRMILEVHDVVKVVTLKGLLMSIKPVIEIKPIKSLFQKVHGTEKNQQI